jgi:hypothetical protein
MTAVMHLEELTGKDDDGKDAPTDPNPKDWVWHFTPVR